MQSEPAESSIPITVADPSGGSGEKPTLRGGPVVHRPEYTVVVPITENLLDAGTGVNVRRLLRTSFALAADNDGRVSLLGIVTLDDESAVATVREYAQSEASVEGGSPELLGAVEDRQSQVARILEVAEELSANVPLSGSVRVVTDTAQGIIGVLDDGTEMAVLLLRGTGRNREWVFSRGTIDTILSKAGCDVFVENLGTDGGTNALYLPDIDDHTVAPLAETEAEEIDSVLLPVGTGPHSALAAEAARAVARSADASVTVLHVIDPADSDEPTVGADDLITFAEYVLGPDIDVETIVREEEDRTAAIVEEAQSHDFTSIGAPEQKSQLEQFVFGSVQETLADRSDVTVLMARDADDTMRSLYYRWKRGIDASEGNDGTE